MLRNKLMMACSAVLLTAALYGCSSSSNDGANMQVKDLKEQIAALNAELGEGEELTPEALAALIAARDAAEAALELALAAQEAAETAQTAAEAAQMAAEGERDAANTAAAAAETARMAAETARMAADAAQMAAETARMAAEGERDAANMAAAAAATAQMTAEGERDTANMAAAAAATAQMTAEGERDTANMAAAAAEIARMAAVEAQDAAVAAQGMAEADRDAANMRATEAMEAAALAMTAATEAGQRADAAETAQMTAEGERDAANTRADTADAAQMTAEGERDAANTRADTADAAQMTAEGERDAANTRADTAGAAQMTAEGERDAANTRADTADAAQKTAEGERDAANTRADTADAALKTAQGELAELKEDLADEIAAGAKADRIAREDMVRKAIATPGTGTENALPVDASGVERVKASRNVAGTVTIDVNADDEDDVYAGGEVTAGSGDWNSVTLTMTDPVDADTDTVVLYTDIEAPADVDFGTVYVSGTNFLANELNAPTKGNVAKALADNFPTGNGVSKNYGVVSSVDSGNPLTFRGTFDDVPGVFACDTAGCTLSTNAKGELTGTTEVWNFTPDAPNSAKVKVPDANYAYFGWWLNKPKDNTETHTVEVFAGGTTGHLANVTDAIEGNATYEGPAAGKYVTRTFTAGVHSDSAVGHFTAAANLTARFDNESELGTGIKGSISSFVLDDTNSVPWKVTLETAMFNTGEATFTGKTKVDFGGGARDDEDGDWQGSFYDDAPATPAGGAPGTVAGTFDAATENASVIGAFGATKQ